MSKGICRKQAGAHSKAGHVSPSCLCSNQMASVERKLMKLDRVESILDHEQWNDGKLPSIMLQSPIHVNLTASIMLNTALVKSVLIKWLARHVSIVTFSPACFIHRLVAKPPDGKSSPSFNSFEGISSDEQLRSRKIRSGNVVNHIGYLSDSTQSSQKWQRIYGPVLFSGTRAEKKFKKTLFRCYFINFDF